MLAVDPIWKPAVQQAHYRLLIEAMSYPGRQLAINTLPEKGLSALTVLSTLLDAEVTLADPHNLLCSEDWQMLQTNSVPAEEADYILCDASQTPDFKPKLGSLHSPEKSATLILVIDNFSNGNLELNLIGAGIKNKKSLSLSGLDPVWLSMREEYNDSFPLGIDFIFIDKTHIAALPRTTKVEIMSWDM